ncbi:MAG: hypothetical protein LBL76_11220 [Treponema sp.]|jgi:hypothetical protein|nr:hypothetical protein [Treponema sp.]
MGSIFPTTSRIPGYVSVTRGLLGDYRIDPQGFCGKLVFVEEFEGIPVKPGRMERTISFLASGKYSNKALTLNKHKRLIPLGL